ncbi:50S ribosomal L10 domain protein [Mycobacterium xenopi 4042]|uniref:50S ribosomal L10 domain protein n=1 Tax=Mycobacterium xenopi 4042 TaxID=1299334 RepID=X7ZYK5_MYCXE|nr:50S ribosomal L10 domain protein [Mycobacterium xenopi 4042]
MCARPHPAPGVRGFRAGVYWSKPWTGNDFHVSTRQEAGMVRAEKAPPSQTSRSGSSRNGGPDHRIPGLTVANLAELRRALGTSATYSVARTRWSNGPLRGGHRGARRTVRRTDRDRLRHREPVDAAKAIKTFAKEHRRWSSRVATWTAPADRRRGRAHRRPGIPRSAAGQVAGAMKGNLAKAAGLFNAPASQVARLPQRCRTRNRRAAAAPDTPPNNPAVPHQGRTTPWQSCPPTNCSTRSKR